MSVTAQPVTGVSPSHPPTQFKHTGSQSGGEAKWICAGISNKYQSLLLNSHQTVEGRLYLFSKMTETPFYISAEIQKGKNRCVFNIILKQ